MNVKIILAAFDTWPLYMLWIHMCNKVEVKEKLTGSGIWFDKRDALYVIRYSK